MKETWTEVITPKRSLLDLNLKEVWRYRDLIILFVRRDFVSQYKQTILGPLWLFLSPLFTVLSFNFVFSEIGKISTEGIPGPLFYLAGTTLWNYFQSCFTGTASTFISNAGIFGKVYFPRLVAPISVVISNLLKFFLQMLMFLVFWAYYFYKGDIQANGFISLFPILVIIMATMGLGLGIIFSSLTTKYRDLSYFIGFGITILMFISPVIYPISAIPEIYKPYLFLNPIAPVIEAFRSGFTGAGTLSWGGLIYSLSFSLIVLFLGAILFNQTEKTFMDTV
jgi:lipopolysaccharide transport system permease protein